MTNIESKSFDILMCAIRELERTKCPKIFLKRCSHETEKFDAWNRYLFQPFSWGKYGAIGKLSLDGERVRAGETKLVVKTNRHPIANLKIKFSENTLILDENIAEIVFAALVKLLFDLGACPFYVRYAGYLFKQPIVYLFSEKCCFEFSHILKRQRDGTSKAVEQPNLLMNCIFQMIYAVYVYKAYFNLVHFDTHIRNVMLKTNNRETYRGVKWSDCKYIVFRDKRTSTAIVIKNYDYVVKLLDFGLCFASLDKSPLAASRVRLETGMRAHAFVDTPSKSNTIDVMYFLLHVYQYMNFGLDKNFGSTTTEFGQDRRHFAGLIANINEFSLHFFGKSFSEYANANVPDRNGEGKLLYLLKQHNVGVENPMFNQPQGLMEGLIRFCRAAGFARQGCVVDGSSDFTVYSHEPVVDFVFEPKHCMMLDAGIAMPSQDDSTRVVGDRECLASIQWWSTTKFDSACRSLQRVTPDCNIMHWIVARYGRPPPGRKLLVLLSSSPPPSSGPALVASRTIFLRENVEYFSKEAVRLKRVVFHRGKATHFSTDSYEKRNFIGTLERDDAKLAIVCFGNSFGDISLAKACETFERLGMRDVYEFFGDTRLCVEHKDRTTWISGSSAGRATKTVKLCVASL